MAPWQYSIECELSELTKWRRIWRVTLTQRRTASGLQWSYANLDRTSSSDGIIVNKFIQRNEN